MMHSGVSEFHEMAWFWKIGKVHIYLNILTEYIGEAPKAQCWAVALIAK